MLVYIDTSVALAHLFAEDRRPSDALWLSRLITSRLTHYETWARVHARSLGPPHEEAVHALLNRIATVELDPMVLARVLKPFPRPVRTLDALHLATIEFLRAKGLEVHLASYDDRMVEAARLLGINIGGI